MKTQRRIDTDHLASTKGDYAAFLRPEDAVRRCLCPSQRGNYGRSRSQSVSAKEAEEQIMSEELGLLVLKSSYFCMEIFPFLSNSFLYTRFELKTSHLVYAAIIELSKILYLYERSNIKFFIMIICILDVRLLGFYID